ncbi:MAG: DUF2202 domain-containing protein [Polyangiaceae bacterium]|nr:DUF2202 domain-containing protein [Polyangiaceae bacterium]
MSLQINSNYAATRGEAPRAWARTPSLKLALAAIGFAALSAVAGCASHDPEKPNVPANNAAPAAQPYGVGWGGGRGAGPVAGRGMGMGMGRGMGPGAGMGMGPGNGMGPLATCPIEKGALPEDTKNALLQALEDERAAEHEYKSVIEQFGSVLPFAHIQRAEERHADAIEALLSAHGIAIPEETSTAAAAHYDSLAAACKAAVTAEKANIAMYDELSKAALVDDVECVFEHLRAASLNRHLPVFEACAQTQ